MSLGQLSARLGGSAAGESSRSAAVARLPEPSMRQRGWRPEAGVAVIGCGQVITAWHLDNLGADIRDAAHRAEIVVVDLSSTQRIEAVVLSVLLAGARDCRAAGAGMCIVGAQTLVARVLRFTGVATVVPVFETIGQALDTEDVHPTRHLA